jgi:hypothetical protein
MNPKRQPKGIENGGQFAASINPESTVVLDDNVRVDPGFGKSYGGNLPYVTADGAEVFMYRNGQAVRFFDGAGNQVGPEQSNVAPAVAYAQSQGWRESQPRPSTSIWPASELKPGQRVVFRDVACEVVSAMERDGHTDKFGRKENVVQFRRLDTGEEGPMYFGPGGIVHLLNEPDNS